MYARLPNMDPVNGNGEIERGKKASCSIWLDAFMLFFLIVEHMKTELPIIY